MRTMRCNITSNRLVDGMSELHGEIPVDIFFAGNKVIKFSTQSGHPFAGYALSDLLVQYLGKIIPSSTVTLNAKVPRCIVEDWRQRQGGRPQQQELLLEPKPFQVEVGKFYWRRDGKSVGPIRHSVQSTFERYPFVCYSLPDDEASPYLTFTANGEYTPGRMHKFDLVAEVAAPATQLEVGTTTGKAPQDCKPAVSPAAPLKDISALGTQEGGDHYKKLRIQPVEYIHANAIPFAEGSVIKYVTRWRDKNGIADLKKARHFIDLLIELEERAK